MAEYLISAIDDFDLAIITVLEKIDATGMIAAIEDVGVNYRAKNLIFDLSLGKIDRMTAGQIREYALGQRERIEKRRGGITFLVSSNSNDHYAFNYFVELTADQGDWPVEYWICNTVGEALAVLKRQARYLPGAG